MILEFEIYELNFLGLFSIYITFFAVVFAVRNALSLLSDKAI